MLWIKVLYKCSPFTIYHFTLSSTPWPFQDFAQPAVVPPGDVTTSVTRKVPVAPSAGSSGSQVQTDVQDPTPGGSKTKEETEETMVRHEGR